MKCARTEHFAVVGFEPDGKRGVAALKIARLDDGVLVPCGSVGSGIGREASADLRYALDDGQHLVVLVEHRGVTPAGELRHPVFRGW